MTTIATDGKSMAGDGRACRNSLITNDACVKVFKLADGSLLGGAGNRHEIQQFRKWLETGGKRPKMKDMGALVLRPDGTLLYYTDSSDEPTETGVPNALGTGDELAIAAMDAGASPEEAVKIACRRDVHSGGLITTVCLAEPIFNRKFTIMSRESAAGL